MHVMHTVTQGKYNIWFVDFFFYFFLCSCGPYEHSIPTLKQRHFTVVLCRNNVTSLLSYVASEVIAHQVTVLIVFSLLCHHKSSVYTPSQVGPIKFRFSTCRDCFRGRADWSLLISSLNIYPSLPFKTFLTSFFLKHTIPTFLYIYKIQQRGRKKYNTIR